jgi:hypothetical protein
MPTREIVMATVRQAGQSANTEMISVNLLSDIGSTPGRLFGKWIINALNIDGNCSQDKSMYFVLRCLKLHIPI